MNTVVKSAAAASDHPDHWKLIAAAILAIWQQAEPIAVSLMDPKTGAIVEVATQLAPVVLQVTIAAIPNQETDSMPVLQEK